MSTTLLPVIQRQAAVPAEAPDFVRNVLGPMIDR